MVNPPTIVADAVHWPVALGAGVEDRIIALRECHRTPASQDSNPCRAEQQPSPTPWAQGGLHGMSIVAGHHRSANPGWVGGGCLVWDKRSEGEIWGTLRAKRRNAFGVLGGSHRDVEEANRVVDRLGRVVAQEIISDLLLGGCYSEWSG